MRGVRLCVCVCTRKSVCVCRGSRLSLGSTNRKYIVRLVTFSTSSLLSLLSSLLGRERDLSVSSFGLCLEKKRESVSPYIFLANVDGVFPRISVLTSSRFAGTPTNIERDGEIMMPGEREREKDAGRERKKCRESEKDTGRGREKEKSEISSLNRITNIYIYMMYLYRTEINVRIILSVHIRAHNVYFRHE